MISLNYYPDHTRASNVCNASVEINNSKQANQIQSISVNASIKKSNSDPKHFNTVDRLSLPECDDCSLMCETGLWRLFVSCTVKCEILCRNPYGL